MRDRAGLFGDALWRQLTTQSMTHGTRPTHDAWKTLWGGSVCGGREEEAGTADGRKVRLHLRLHRWLQRQEVLGGLHTYIHRSQLPDDTVCARARASELTRVSAGVCVLVRFLWRRNRGESGSQTDLLCKERVDRHGRCGRRL